MEVDVELTVYNLALSLMEEQGKSADEACDELERQIFMAREELRYKDEE